MQAFVYNGQPSRVVFGQGALSHLEREIDLLGAGRALVLATPEQRAQAEMIADRLGGRVAGIFARAVVHVPIETARDARDEARRLGRIAPSPSVAGPPSAWARPSPWSRACPSWLSPRPTPAAR